MARRILTAAEAVGNGQGMNLTRYARLRPTIVGPCARLRRYTETDEKALTLLGSYVPGADTAFDWPNLGASETADPASARVFLESGLLRYLYKPVGSGGTAIPPASPNNRVRASAYVFKTANGTDRSAAFGDRDVTVGDTVKLSAVVSSALVTHTSVVTGFVGEAVAATTGTAAAASTNRANQSAPSTTYSQVSGTPANYVEISTTAGTYNSLADGGINRTYTVTVIQSGTGGVGTTALLKVESSDGLDDVASLSPAAFASATTIGTKGLTVTWVKDTGNSVDSGVDADDFVAGQKWTIAVGQAYTKPTGQTAAGTYTGPIDRTYVVTVVTGGTLGSGTATITCVSSDGADSSGPTAVTAAAAAIQVGNYGNTIAFAGVSSMLYPGDVYSFAVTAATEGAVQTLTLRDDVPSNLRTGGAVDCDLELFVTLPAGTELPETHPEPSAAANWTADADGITLESGAYMTVDGLTDGGEPVYAALRSATCYVSYRAWDPMGGAPVRVATVAEAEEALGSLDADNPLGYAVGKALANTAAELLTAPSPNAAANTDPVVFMPVAYPVDDVDSWQTAFDALSGEEDTHQLVPLSTDPEVHAVAAAHAAAESDSAVSRWRTVYAPASVTSPTQLVPASGQTTVPTATVATSGGEFVAVTGVNTAFVTNGVRSGDSFRINYGTDEYGDESYEAYEIDEVVSETSLTLASGPSSAVPVAVRAEVWRTPTPAELVEQLATKAAALADTRVCLVWPDEVVDSAGETVPGYTAVAALAGLAGSVPSHQGLRGVGVEGFSTAPRSLGLFTNAQLDDLSAAGVFVLAADASGGLYVRSAKTTDTSGVYASEEMRTRNGDMILLNYDSDLDRIRGVGNFTDGVEETAKAMLDALAVSLRGSNTSRTLGPPVGTLRLVGASAVAGRPDGVALAIEATGNAVPLNLTATTLTQI